MRHSCAIAAVLACLWTVTAAAATTIDNAALRNETDGRNWAAYGRTFSETHYSPLTEINRETVSRLNLAWTLDLDVTNNLSTPLAVDGVIYVASGYSFVHAVDARSGKLLWRYDPEVAKAAGAKLRTGWGIRGLAFWKGRLFVGTHDGRLIAIDAKTGQPVWTVQTIDTNDGSFISGPPRVFNDKVIIGFGGGDFGAVRGYVTAYDTATGKQVWRWWTVPGDPAKGFENKAMEMAAKTWTGEWWKYGGGGTVWNAMTYDPEFNRVYLGTGNGGPWNWKIRSPGGGDNLFLCSVVALDADTGEYVWHYQTTPGDSWDYNSAMDMTLATLNIGGAPRKVLLHAPKNGFFYVIDRENGKLISAEKLGTVTWATKVDLATGRPVLAPNARYENGPVTLWPSFQGVHNLYPQSFSPKTGLVYVPTIEMPATFGGDVDYKNWRPLPSSIQFTGFPTADGDAPADGGKSFLVAWDPVKQRAAWQQPTPGPHNGGTLATAGDLVFQGQADGYINAYGASDGRRVWSYYAATAALGTPITFAVGKTQYIAILTGPLHGAPGGFGSMAARFGWDSRVHPRRLLAFVLDGKAKLPPTPPPVFAQPLDGPEMQVDEALVKEGIEQWSRCQLCHGPGAVAGGTAPDLRASTVPLNPALFSLTVRTGNEARGMPKFTELNDRELDALRHYIRYRARLATRPDGVAPPPPEAAPAEAQEPETAAPEKKPPGSLESSGPPPGQ
ncbi:MAG TPA: PQQ-dependent dehydrogenase, methanol/ethanol family [Steroidobacteraceae bacterium]|jgi:quinohemoprotein ethanol dehydrogenase|nr:PQQ-dependent dehydrogenase, methanol/ethanol family [Steroidobacteraceae bacterium]